MPGHEQSSSVTRGYLLCGIIAGPLYLTVGVAQGLLREGFDFGRHPLSVLANGPLGWLQAANFLLSGLMVIAASAGVRQVLGREARGLTWSLGGYGAAMIAASIFTADPVDGFPPGTPLGMPTTISTMGLLHFVCGAFAFLFLGLSGLFGAWTLWKRGLGLAAASLLSGVTVLVGFFGGVAVPGGIAGIWAAVIVGSIWLSLLSARLLREAWTLSTDRRS